jgi:deoxyadenosine/deoxycytidine kinase
MVLLIHGNAGVGKSTVAHMMNEKISQESIVVEVDKLRYNVVDQRVDTDKLDLVDQQVFAAAEAFLNTNYETVIIEGVYPSQNHLHKVVDRLHKIDPEVFVFRLDCSLRENLKRDNNRDDELTVGDKVKEVFEEFDRLDHEKEIGEVVDTTGISPGETLRRIEEMILMEKGRV